MGWLREPLPAGFASGWHVAARGRPGRPLVGTPTNRGSDRRSKLSSDGVNGGRLCQGLIDAIALVEGGRPRPGRAWPQIVRPADVGSRPAWRW